jgi:hypothetical protein
MAARPPYSFYEVVSIYVLSSEGLIRRADSRLHFRPPGAAARVNGIASRALGALTLIDPPAGIEVNQIEVERLFDGAAGFWQMAPLLANATLRIEPAGELNGHHLSLQLNQIYRLEPGGPILADHGRFWISLMEDGLIPPNAALAYTLRVSPQGSLVFERVGKPLGVRIPGALLRTLEQSWQETIAARSKQLLSLLG